MGSRYFRLEAQEALWAAICRSRAVALYVPPALKDVKLDLIWTK
jgi:predicted component of type VI protein secretion system